MKGEADRQGRPRIELGWVAVGGDGHVSRVRRAAERVEERLAGQFPDFDWRSQVVERPLARRRGEVDPLDLLESGVQEKVEQGWDFALVVSDSELRARERPFTFGAPSSALETAVMSSVRCGASEDPESALAALALFLFGSLLGLEPNEEGAMRPPSAAREPELADFIGVQAGSIRERLADVGDERLEERGGRWNRLGFRLRTIAADPHGILRDLWGYRPWKQPFRLGRLSAAAVVSTLLAFLGAEVWELGVAAGTGLLVGGAFGSVAVTSWFLYRGQNLSSSTRDAGLSEQVARSEVVLGACLLVGIGSLWLLLFLGSYALASVLPAGVIGGWLDERLEWVDRVRFAAFVSSLGTLAGGLGGNLEDEDAFKAEFFFDEEV